MNSALLYHVSEYLALSAPNHLKLRKRFTKGLIDSGRMNVLQLSSRELRADIFTNSTTKATHRTVVGRPLAVRKPKIGS